MKRKRCRLWWPKDINSSLSSANELNLIFGWFISSTEDDFTNLDIVVAFACHESNSQINLQAILDETNRNMHTPLHDKHTFSLLGFYLSGSECNGSTRQVGIGKHTHSYSTHLRVCLCGSENTHKILSETSMCLCCRYNQLLEHNRMTSVGSNRWLQLEMSYIEQRVSKALVTPELHHIHWNGATLSQLDVHVIVYDVPKFGCHYYSLGSDCETKQLSTSSKRPMWVEDLHESSSTLDLDAVFLAINSVNAANMLLERHLAPQAFANQCRIICKILTFSWQLLAILVASFWTLCYVILQFFYKLFSFISLLWVYNNITAKAFCNTFQNIQIRCSQFMYWPVFLQNDGLRAQPCVEYAEKAALQRHSMWSTILVDLFLGNLLGAVLWFHAESVYFWVSSFSDGVTNYVLRTGCVWLMENPAGFKLNTDLAGILGMISLNAIQIWSTLWFFMSDLFVHFIKLLALSGIIFGFTTPASTIIDVISLATIHISALHWLISLIYSQQIEAIASLWRLFRGKKCNPLRQRLDSYEYTVEQHVVGSLLFTPLLLLLPTTSAFYMFFTILITTFSFICFIMVVIVSVIHATPYNKILLWLLNKGRFPSGMWIEIISCSCNHSPKVKSIGGVASSSHELKGSNDDTESTTLVSSIHNNFQTLATIVFPHYICLFLAISRSSSASSAHGILTGKSIPSSIGITLPSMLPWMAMPYRDYWCLCYKAVHNCKSDCMCHRRQ
ncbi:hypothetical protein Leryth_010296 [Lithospermum erythrorhizon]|nr:hypothetical protein Leryth_010296 [Lithospermum erythrorhizon]